MNTVLTNGAFRRGLVRLSRILASYRQSCFAGLILILLALVALSSPLCAENAAFDLIGPNVQVRVQRAGVTLPISEVPNLQAGDRLWIHPDLPDSQSVRYLMVVAFLRGA